LKRKTKKIYPQRREHVSLGPAVPYVALDGPDDLSNANCC